MSVIWRTLKNVLLYTVAVIAILFVLVVIYKILKFLLVAAVLLIGWLGVVPRKWR